MKFALLLVLFVAWSSASIVKQLSLYECYDPDFLNTAAPGKVQMTMSTMFLPRTELEFFYETNSTLAFTYQNGPERVKYMYLRMYCRRTELLDQFAFTDTFRGTLYDASGVQHNVNSRLVIPTLAGQVRDDGTLTGGLIYQYTDLGLRTGAPLVDLSYSLMDSNPFGCVIPGLNLGCLNLKDYNPNIQKEPVIKTCKKISDNKPVATENCGPVLTITKMDETTETTVQSVSVGTSVSTGMNIAAEFAVQPGVSVSPSPAGADDFTSQYGSTAEVASSNSRTATSLNYRSTARTFQIEHGRSLLEEKLTETCTGRGVAKGCLDSSCTYSFRFEYEIGFTSSTSKFTMRSIDCSRLTV